MRSSTKAYLNRHGGWASDQNALKHREKYVVCTYVKKSPELRVDIPELRHTLDALAQRISDGPNWTAELVHLVSAEPSESAPGLREGDGEPGGPVARLHGLGEDLAPTPSSRGRR